jgi:hypothetical protein
MLYTLKCLILVLSVCVFGACSYENEPAKKDSNKIQIDSSFNYSGDVYRIKETNAFGYIIRKGHRNLIHQTFLPAVEGRKPLNDSLKARKLMEKSIEKLNHGEFPPALTLKEVLDILEEE